MLTELEEEYCEDLAMSGSKLDYYDELLALSDTDFAYIRTDTISEIDQIEAEGRTRVIGSPEDITYYDLLRLRTLHKQADRDRRQKRASILSNFFMEEAKTILDDEKYNLILGYAQERLSKS